MASAAKLRGEAAAAGVRSFPVGSTAGLIDDAVELLDLVRCWSKAARRCATEGPTAANLRVGPIAEDWDSPSSSASLDAGWRSADVPLQ